MKAPTALAKLLLIAVVTGAATTGCATGGTLASRTVADRQAAVRIRNDNWSDMKVYVVPAGGGIPVRIGTVRSLATERIPLRGRIRSEILTHGSLRFLLRPLAAPRELSHTFGHHDPGPRDAPDGGKPPETFDACGEEPVGSAPQPLLLNDSSPERPSALPVCFWPHLCSCCFGPISGSAAESITR